MIRGSCSSYLKTAAKVGSFLLQNIPWTEDSDGATPDVQVLCNLAGEILSDIKETEIGKVTERVTVPRSLKFLAFARWTWLDPPPPFLAMPGF